MLSLIIHESHAEHKQFIIYKNRKIWYAIFKDKNKKKRGQSYVLENRL